MHCSCDNLNSTLNTPPGLAPVLPFGKIVAGRGLLSVITAMKNFETRFWEKVDKSGGPNSCWNWTGAKHSFGYGSVRISRRAYKAHRVSYEWLIGPIPEGMCLLHTCDNPMCVNPSHLQVGTKMDNTQDMMKKGRHKYITHPK